MRKRPSALAGGFIAIALLGGCGGSQDAGAGVESAPPAASGDAQCDGTPREGVALDAQAQACADNGFEIGADVFAFANWGGPGSLDAAGMVAMFGPEDVCADQAGGGCTLFPAAQAWLDQVNQAMAGGRCEGMAVVAARLEDGGDPVASLQRDAQVTVDLRQETEPVVNEIEYWWATQMVPQVAGPTAEIRAMQPSEVVATLVQGLRDGTGYTLGMYANGAGHAVTPFAVSRSADGTYDIAIYDNNDPSTIAHVLVDPVAQRWSYEQGAINPDAQAAAWTGAGPGTLDLTAMQWRQGPFVAPFADSEEAAAKGDVTRTFLVTAGVAPGEGSVGAQISAGGVTVDTTTALDAAVELPAGVVVTPIKAQARGEGTVVGVQVTAPRSVGTVSVAPVVRARSQAGEPGLRIIAQVSVDAPGQPRVTASGQVAGGPTSGGQAAFELTSNGDGTTGVQARRGVRIVAQVATGRASITIPLPPSGQISVSDDEDGRSEVVVTDEEGQEAELVVDGMTDGEVTQEVATFDDGEWVVQEWDEQQDAPWSDEEWFAEDDPGTADADPAETDAAETDAAETDAGESGSSESDSSESDAGNSDSSESDSSESDSSDSDAGNAGGNDSGGGDSGGGDSGDEG